MGHNLTYKLNDFYRLDKGDGRYEVWIWSGFDKVFKEVTKGDKQGAPKVSSWILRLAHAFPQGEDKVKPLKGGSCKGKSIWELKPKPYRVAFMCLCGRYMLVGYIWRKRANTRDSAEIEKACKLMAELAEKFLEEVEPCS